MFVTRSTSATGWYVTRDLSLPPDELIADRLLMGRAIQWCWAIWPATSQLPYETNRVLLVYVIILFKCVNFWCYCSYVCCNSRFKRQLWCTDCSEFGCCVVWSCCSEIQCLCVYLTELERQRKALAQRILARLTLFVLVALKLGMCKIDFLISVRFWKKTRILFVMSLLRFKKLFM